MKFKDLFSDQAKEYAKYRPGYSEDLFKYLGSLAASHQRAWDCATGNGQAAIGLAPYFSEVIATDASSEQIKYAKPHPKIKYFAAAAENSGIASDSCDLVTVATAIHWIDTERFYPQVKRILKPGGIIGIWLYVDNTITPEIDELFERFFKDVLYPNSDPGIDLAMNFENSVAFPFKRLEAPEFKIELDRTADEHLKYLSTWSSAQAYRREHGKDPVDMVREDVVKLWGSEKRRVTWRILMKAGINEK